MAENKLVPTKKNELIFDEEICGVKVERSKRKRKKKRRLKKAILVLLFACLTAIIVKNYSGISSFIASLFNSPQPPNQSQSNESGKNDISNDLENENGYVSDESNTYEFKFIDTFPTEFIILDKNQASVNTNNLFYELPMTDDIYNVYGDNSPVVLIVNYSPLECYSQGNGYSYDSKFYDYDNNVEQIGEQLCASLNSLGISAIHLKLETGDLVLSDYQQRYAKEIEQILESNPSIAYIFDVSRALSINNDMSMNREQIELNGTNVPTVKFVCGTSGGALTESQAKGIYVAAMLAKHANESAPLLISTLEISSLDLNQKFSVPCIRVEIGSYSCTYEQSSLSADYFALSISSFLKE